MHILYTGNELTRVRGEIVTDRPHLQLINDSLIDFRGGLFFVKFAWGLNRVVTESGR
jgi:hypothetical protein